MGANRNSKPRQFEDRGYRMSDGLGLLGLAFVDDEDFAFAENDLSLSDELGGKDLAGGGVASALEGPPHVPAGDGAVGSPLFAEGQEFLGFGHVLLAVGDGPALFYPEVVDGEDIGATQIENQEHLDSPGADAADRDQTLDELFVGHFPGLLARGDDTFERFAREIFHGQDLCTGKTGFAECELAELEHLLRRGRAIGAAQGLDAGEDGGGGLPGDGLVSDGFEESFVGAVGGVHAGLELGGFGNEKGELLVFF
jgi:hypothetical protein